ncbi:inhibitor of vertebrate lysozyme family protein [Pseudomonas sp.]|uniref:inhibitor of vertebrate lysozyme family protein n=1 Tax=Pseudomonas sp. TaxID=306 RepID=UPI0028AC3D32|nr:inhibitor of vertebrate lysozyme family protein [Pseudomonas sp.]
MNNLLRHTLAAALLLGSSTATLAANDGQVYLNQLLGSGNEYRGAWQDAIKGQERLPDWVINLSGTAQQQMSATTEDGDKYLVGSLCESEQTCSQKRLVAAFSWDKDDAYGLLVEAPAESSPTHDPRLRWIGDPDDGMKAMLKEQL